MIITLTWLQQQNACQEGVDWVTAQKLTELDAKAFLQGLVDGGKLQWAVWLVLRLLAPDDAVRFAVFFAKDYYSTRKINDTTLADAVNLAETCLTDGTASRLKTALDTSGRLDLATERFSPAWAAARAAAMKTTVGHWSMAYQYVAEDTNAGTFRRALAYGASLLTA